MPLVVPLPPDWQLSPRLLRRGFMASTQDEEVVYVRRTLSLKCTQRRVRHALDAIHGISNLNLRHL